MFKNYCHPTAIVEQNVVLGNNIHIWHFTHIREHAIIEDDVSIARDVYVDKGVRISKGTRIQNGVSIYSGVQIAPYCFIGPHVIFTNDLRPRAGNKQWSMTMTYLQMGCTLGAGAIVKAGITVGEYALVGAGSVVTHNIPPFNLAVGNPARVKAMVCSCGRSNLPLDTPRLELLRDCCYENLNEDAINHVKEYLMSVINH
ncbi:MAG: N-acetyltransferase [Oligoflexia bacterium]|nr:N-acetyltransferase [Oligoflexia bacterium]